jgi:L-ascorbate metabolism protein UlaG (beta-lactamase superfamily)
MPIKYTYIGHGTHGLEINNKQIIVDPFFTNNPLTNIPADSVTADFILVSHGQHGHADHVGDVVSIAKRTGAKVISNAEIGAWLQRL